MDEKQTQATQKTAHTAKTTTKVRLDRGSIPLTNGTVLYPCCRRSGYALRQVVSDFFGLQRLRKKNYVLVVQIAILLTILYIAFAVLVQTRFWNELDLDVSLWIYDNLQSNILDSLASTVNKSGGASLWLTLGALLCIPKKTRKLGIVLLAVVFITNLILLGILKDIAARTRPWMYINLPSTGMPGGYSFPSGHSLVAFAAATVFYMTDKRLGYIAYPVAAFIAFSRVYMFAHFASDVIMGAVIGTGAAIILVVLITEGWDKMFNVGDEAPHPLPAPPDPDDTDYGFNRLLRFRDEGYGSDKIYDRLHLHHLEKLMRRQGGSPPEERCWRSRRFLSVTP